MRLRYFHQALIYVTFLMLGLSTTTVSAANTCRLFSVSDKIEVKGSGKILSNGTGVAVTTNSTGKDKIKLEGSGTISGDVLVGPGGNPNTVIKTSGGGNITGSTGSLTSSVTITNPGIPNVGANEGNKTYSSSGTTVINSNRHFNKLEIKNSAVVEIDGDVIIVVDDKLELKNSAKLRVRANSSLILYVNHDVKVKNDSRLNDTGQDPSRLTIYVYGNKKFEMESTTKAYAKVVAKDGELKLKGSSKFYGAFLGNKAKFENSGQFTMDTKACLSAVTLPDPIAEWRMDETSWGVVSDSSGNNLNGTSINGAFTDDTSPAIAGTPGTCRYGEFDGSNDFIRVADNPLLDISNELTVTAWINPDQIPASGLKSILSKDENYEFHVDSSGQIYWWWYNASNQEKTLTTTGASLTTGTWYHIAIVYRSGSQKIYIDGVERASSSEVGNLLLNSDPLEIGADQGHSGRYFDGSIDEARVYDVALSQAQVQVVKDITRPCAAAPPTPIAEWRFDEDQWTGAANEVKDNGSGGYHGRAVNSAVTASSTPAITGDPGTCGYGSFTSSRYGSVRVDGLPIPTSSGSQVTVTFWMYWKGGRWSMPFGFSKYNLFFNNGNHFGFETWDWATYGISSSGLANGWHHIAAVFTDNDVYQNRLIVDGVEQSLSTRGGQMDNRNAQLSSSISISGVTSSTGWWFDGYLDEVRIYSGALQVPQVQAIMAETHPCSASVDPFAFNCIESGGDALTGKLYTKTVGQSFSVDVVALEDADGDGTADGVETDYASDADRTVSVELIDTSSAAACTAYPAISPAVSQNLVFADGNNGRKVSATMSVAKAYRSLGCRVTDSAGSSPVTGCSTDAFAVRPTALTLGIPALTNGGSSGTPTATAGSSFTLTADADAGYDGTPKTDSSKLGVHSGAIQTGTLTGSFNAANPATGTATGTAFSYSEVGNFRFLAEGVYDDTFTAVDQSSDCTNDFSNSLVGGKVGCKFGNTATTSWVGRFIPADFVVSIDADGALQNSCVAGGFSYSGEGIGFDPANQPRATITARNSSGVTTQNYTGSYSKLSVVNINMPSISTDGTQVGVDGSSRVGLTWATGVPVFTDNGNGTFTFGLSGDSFTYAKTQNDLIAPFTADIDLVIQSIVDSDSVSGTGLPQQFSPTGVPVRFGRMVLANTQGSELNPLNMPMRTEYYNGAANGFISNTNDTCSQVNELRLTNQTGSVVISGAGRNTAIYAPASISTIYAASDLSDLGLLFSQPPTTTPGFFNLNLQATGAGNTGSVEVEALVPDSLKYWWTGTTATEDPKAKATFGIHSRPTSIIYQRESR